MLVTIRPSSGGAKTEVNRMAQIPTPVWEDQKLNQYFKTLPVFVQETIAQTGIQITDEAQLRAVAEKILKGQQK